MGQFEVLNLPKEPLFSKKFQTLNCPKLKNHKPTWFVVGGFFTHSLKCHSVQSSFQGLLEVISNVEASISSKDSDCIEEEEEELETLLPNVQTLRKFPKKDLFEKVVLVRFDSSVLLLQESNQVHRLTSNSISTIKHLIEARAKVVLVSDWSVKKDSKLLSSDSIADSLTTVLRYKVVPVQGISLQGVLSKAELFEKDGILLLDNLSGFNEEVSNCPRFSEMLSSSVDIFVNDSFSRSHKILASNVGVTRFCDARLAGFHFEKSLNRLRNVNNETERKPYVAIIGGGKIVDKSIALRSLASTCDKIVFVGAMAFQIIHALGHSIPSNLVERRALNEASEIVEFAQSLNVKLVYPKDFMCQNDCVPSQFKIFPSHCIMNGWSPVDIGPESLDEITNLLSKSKKILCIGPLEFQESRESKLARILTQLSQSSDCDMTVIGNKACEAIAKESSSVSNFNMLYNASVVWEFLKGRKLPGVEALDRAYPFDIDWKSVYHDPCKPLMVDIGSGNGMFVLGMAKRRNDLNFIGLEINKKLIRRCLDSVRRFGITNGYFIATNATSAFRSIVSSYPGELILVSIQCPNPDFNNPANRWRMLQPSLVEAIIELVSSNGKVFLQSDVESVSLRMKHEFLKHGNGKLVVVNGEENDGVTGQGWLEENPFGVRSDWERQVLDRGSPMYRLMLSKLEIN